jgi:hypothetical protein
VWLIIEATWIKVIIGPRLNGRILVNFTSDSVNGTVATKLRRIINDYGSNLLLMTNGKPNQLGTQPPSGYKKRNFPATPTKVVVGFSENPANFFLSPIDVGYQVIDFEKY